MSEKNKIVVKAEPHFLEAQSSPNKNRFVFAYTISITNVGTISAQLLTRHWLVTDANGKVQEVNGEGVIGEKPYIKPGETYQYTSGAVIDTPVGVMEGKYTMHSSDGESFSVVIPKFTLSIPRILH